MKLIDVWISEGKTSLTADEIRKEIAKYIGFNERHNTIDKYFKSLLIFELIKPDGDKFLINKENIDA